jgi:hypothetical protein
MRLFELLLLLATAAAPFVYSFSEQKKLNSAWLMGVLILAALHVIIEQPRWQLVPLYIAVLLVPLYAQFTRRSRIWLTIAMGFLLLLSATLGTLLPVFKLPTPSGDYAVGAQLFFLEDDTRTEDITPELDDKRRLTLKVWYPTTAENGRTERYLADGLATTFGQEKGIPGFVFSHLPLVKTHTYVDAPFLKEAFPVVLLSHGYLWNAELYTSIVESLVSEGFIVVGIQHTYEAPLVIWEKEQYRPLPNYFEEANAKMDFDRYNELEAAFKASEDETEQLQLMRELMDLLPYEESVNRWTADISFVIDELFRFQQLPDHPLYQQLNLEQLAVIGHSFGGAAAAQACAFDDRLQAGVNLDGAQWGQLIDTTFTTPFLVLYADRNYDEFFTPNFFIFEQAAQGAFYEGFIRQSGHANFGDLGYWTPMHSLTETGLITPDQMQRTLTHLLHQFLRGHLTEEIEDWEEQEYAVGVTLRRVR